MGKEFDELSKALVSGVSRRTAVRRFLLGSLGAVATSLIPGRTSLAQSNRHACCEAACREFGFSGPSLGACVTQCEQAVQFNGFQFNNVEFNGIQFNCV